jgi:hypothetical protein
MIDVKRYSERIDVSERTIYEGIKFILFHFEKQQKLFPRTIKANKVTDQVKVEDESISQKSINKIFNKFKESNYYDCKINCMPYNTPDNQQHGTNTNTIYKNKNKNTAPESFFILISLNLADYSQSRKKLDLMLNSTLKKLTVKFYGDAFPTVLWNGNGYKIYQPLDGMVFEKHKTFYDFLQYADGRDLATEFLRFAQDFFTNGNVPIKYLPSINSCFIDVPGTFNFENGEQVKIIQKWNGKRPSIQWITNDFKNYLIQKKIDKVHERKKEIEKKMSSYHQQQDEQSYKYDL